MVLAILYALVRRLVTRPRRLRFSGEAVLILLWIATLMISDLVADAARFQLHPGDPERGGAYVAAALAGAVRGVGARQRQHRPPRGLLAARGPGPGVPELPALRQALPRAHGAAGGVPRQARALSARCGRWISSRWRPRARRSFGVGKVEEYSWRRILDLYTCTECGRCNEGCPTHVTDKPLHPRELIVDERDHVYAIAGQLSALGTTAGGRQGRGVQGPRGGDRAPRTHRRRDHRGHALGLHHLRLLHGPLPRADRAHRPHRRPAPQPDDDAGEDAPRAADRDARPRDQQQPLERQRARPARTGCEGLPVAKLREKGSADVPALRRLRGQFRRPQPEGAEGAGHLPRPRRRRLRDPRPRGRLLRRRLAAHGQRVPLPDAGAAEHREHSSSTGSAHRHGLPARLQHHQERVPRFRARGCGGPAPQRAVDATPAARVACGSPARP